MMGLGKRKALLALVLGLATFLAVMIAWYNAVEYNAMLMMEFHKTVDVYEELRKATDPADIERLEAELQHRFDNSLGGRFVYNYIGPDGGYVITPHNVTVLPPAYDPYNSP